MRVNDIFNFNSFFRFLSKNKLYTCIEVFGLSVSLMFVILIICFTTQELATDNFQEKKDRLYLLASEESYGFAHKLGEELKNRLPEIEDVCQYAAFLKQVPVTLTENKANADLLFVEPSFFSMISFPIVNGNATDALAARNHAVISERFARRAFPGMTTFLIGVIIC